MKIAVLGSGSKGNATYIESNGICLLIDAGLTKKQIYNRLKQIGVEECFFSGILITHEHTDHTCGLGVLLNRSNAKVYITEKTRLSLCRKTFDMVREHEIVTIDIYKDFQIGDLTITPIPLFHDARECVGFIIKEDDKKVVYITDTGYIHKDVMPLIYDADAYILEANFDPQMLMESSRPFELKQRIIGDYGHLSNQDAAVGLCYSVGERTKTIIFAHRSQECNDLDTLKETVKSIFGDYSVDYEAYDITYAMQDTPTNLKEV